MGSARLNTGSDGGEASDEISLKELILKLQEYPTMKMVFAEIPKWKTDNLQGKSIKHKNFAS